MPVRSTSRLTRLAAPSLVGGITAVVTALATSLDVFNLPVAAGVGITIAALAGLVAWATQRSIGTPRRTTVRPRACHPRSCRR